MDIIMLIIGLLLIVAMSIIFCNALEHLGERLKISEGVTGSLFAGVGTALPETIFPILSIFSFRQGNANNEIGIGAILGAPLMLSTLSLFIMALSVLKKRGLNGLLIIEYKGLIRDLKFFLFGYALAILTTFLQNVKFHGFLNALIAIILGITYFLYVLLTVKDSTKLVKMGQYIRAEKRLFIERLGLNKNKTTIIIQLIIALILLIYFARIFIESVNGISKTYFISPFLISLIIIPIATELPEKINSIIWIRQGRDTLAISNISGALVFQGVLLPIVGILSNNWILNKWVHLVGIIITFLAVIWINIHAKRGNVKIMHFIFNGILYFINIILCFGIFYTGN